MYVLFMHIGSYRYSSTNGLDWWFGIPLTFHRGIPGIQPTNPSHQLTICSIDMKQEKTFRNNVNIKYPMTLLNYEMLCAWKINGNKRINYTCPLGQIQKHSL